MQQGTTTILFGEKCNHETGVFKTINGVEYMICADCGFLEERQNNPCYLCKHCDYAKGFPYCHYMGATKEEKNIARNGQQLALNLNCFKDCKYFSIKNVKKSLWSKLFNNLLKI
jgi:hypothetical protein